MIKNFEKNLVLDHTKSSYPSKLYCLNTDEKEFTDESSFFFGIVIEGTCQISTHFGQVKLEKLCYFALNSDFKITPNGKTVVIQRFGYRGLPNLGSCLENDARLSYIDNCRASVLVAPARKGDPVLNFLVFPPNVNQTAHVHPTIRLGVVVAGSGICKIANNEIPLEVGNVFALNPFEIHCFHSGQQGLKVVAYHPDSDEGPTDESHPMLNRTFVQK